VGVRLALEADTNKLFPVSNSAEEVRDRLVAACRAAGVRFAFGAGLAGMQRRDDGAWRLELSDGGAVEGARRVVLATGGLSFPKLGTTGDGYQLLTQHGHELAEPYAALTPLTGRHPGGQQLAGISLYDTRLAALADGGGGGGRKKGAARQAQRTSMLFTHRGYSGPAVLDLSHLAVRAAERGEAPPQLRVQWTGAGAEEWEARLQEGGAQLVPSLLRREGVPQRLAEALCGEAGVPLDRCVCVRVCVGGGGGGGRGRGRDV
jgi:predicted flavoprotein YhiN